LLERPDRSNILLLVAPPFEASRIDVIMSILSRLEVFFETLRLLAIGILLYFPTTFPRTMITPILLKIRIFCQFSFIVELVMLWKYKDLIFTILQRAAYRDLS
jgi:hypothetical protein